MRTKKLRKTHPADGKFYLTAAMLAERRACSFGINAFKEAAYELGFRDPATQVPVTKELVKRVMHHYGNASAAAFIMDIIERQGRMPPNSSADFYCMDWWPEDYTELAGMAMDFLEHAQHKGI